MGVELDKPDSTGKTFSSVFIHQLWAEWPTTCGDMHKDFGGIQGNIHDLKGDKAP